VFVSRCCLCSHCSLAQVNRPRLLQTLSELTHPPRGKTFLPARAFRLQARNAGLSFLSCNAARATIKKIAHISVVD
jgi:hypothetical protein